MKTAITQILEEIEKMRDPKDLMETIPIDCVLDLIESKLETEKQQIIEANNYSQRGVHGEIYYEMLYGENN